MCYSEAMKTGDKAFVRLDGVVYEGTVKRATALAVCSATFDPSAPLVRC
jgi:hypothetical protein